jgi:hypothetical protein
VSEFYDSRLVSPGAGFPSCSRELVLAPRNTEDPHGYYEELGVDPGASREEIKRAVRKLYVQLHPDLSEDADPERLQRVKDIADVLLDPVKRVKYDRTPKGERLMDKVYAEELRKSGLLKRMDERQIKEAIRTQAVKHPYGVVGRFDFFAVGYKTSDPLKAQQWYHYLMTQAADTGYRGLLRLLLWDHKRPAWDSEQEVLMVPRTWEPSAFAAKTLVTRVIGAQGDSNLVEEPACIPSI